MNPSGRPTVTVVIPCRNRRETTLRSLALLSRNQGEFALDILLVDDDSTDGTAEAAAAEWPEIQVLHGDGDLYWGGAINRGLSAFLERESQYVLWLNDDVRLAPDAIENALATQRTTSADIVAGYCLDDDGNVSYGAVHRHSWYKPLTFLPVAKDVDAARIATFNGNFVLLTRRAVETIGLVDPNFRHRMGDYDYGLRARSRGLRIVQIEDPVGTCNRNPVAGGFLDRDLPRGARFRAMRSLHGMPFGPWARFCLRHGGLLAPIAIVKPYINILFRW